LPFLVACLLVLELVVVLAPEQRVLLVPVEVLVAVY
jgi:hypothetical protein